MLGVILLENPLHITPRVLLPERHTQTKCVLLTRNNACINAIEKVYRMRALVLIIY